MYIYSFIYLSIIYLFIYLFIYLHYDLVILLGYYFNKLPHYEIFQN